MSFGDGAEREAFWGEHVESWKSSGQTLAGYCRAHGLSEGGFYYWRKKLNGQAARCPQGQGAPAFVELELGARGAAAVEVVLCGGRRVQVHPGFDERTLARVVEVLEQGS
jgi:hypothetical protein